MDMDVDMDKAAKDDDEMSRFIKKEEGAKYETGALKQVSNVLASSDALEQKRKNDIKKTDVAQAPDFNGISTFQHQHMNTGYYNK
ncbi:hypothetical protein DL766_000843 [Monosporascus sp. MC13-8B]|uniref:Uncharacterized protein n=1 Tax=Monosporascus cannonballus TaxID=155416 RepID=A0ABY0H0C2_9PEZI|nr:hypothetical protein DL762_007025 [Monosporascus cannonballus]RYO94121.1 hypothetical protein DL763_004189 [Monosporascus cannonballus]RYP38633.1 hypothetical protein DL766_000843 [Monosporascus sp. MC13-8B]